MPEFKPEQSQEWHDDGLGEIIDALEHEGGMFEFRGWPIHYDLASDHPELGERVPGEYYLNAVTNRYDIFTRVWEGVPEAFRKIVLYHEVQEATIASGNADEYVIGGEQRGRMPKEEAHVIAEPLHWAYAERTLSADELETFRAWNATLPRHRAH
jgi:hypothetical protein